MKKIVSLFFLALLLYSCQENITFSESETQIISTEDLSLTKSYEFSEFDRDIKIFAKYLAKSLENEDLRKKVKSEALLKKDGDFDIIWKDFKDLRIGSMNDSISSFIISKVGKEKKEIIKKDLDDFYKVNKRLQISVPIKCKEWQAESFIPLVAFVTSDINEDSEFVEAFDSNGNVFKLSLKEDPDYPVVVVSLNERSDKNGDILDCYKKNNNKKALIIIDDDILSRPVLTNVSSSLCYQVDLTWTYATNTSITAFKIYRKAYGSSTFTLLATVSPYIRSYYDTYNISGSQTYYYYVTAVAGSDESIHSNALYTTTPSCSQPTDPDNLEINYLSSNIVNLTWDNVTNETGYIIKQRVFDFDNDRFVDLDGDGEEDDWEPIGTTATNQTEFEVSDFEYNYQYYYKVWAFNNYYTSAPTDHVIVYSSERSISNYEVVGNCYFTSWAALREYESWVAGAPEMAVKIVALIDGATTTTVVVDEHHFEPDRDDDIVYPSIYYWGESMFNWDVRTLPVVVTWVWYEKDPTDAETTYNFVISGEILKTGIKVSTGANVKLTYADDLIYSCPVNWHDEFPKEYSNGYFTFTLNNE